MVQTKAIHFVGNSISLISYRFDLVILSISLILGNLPVISPDAQIQTLISISCYSLLLIVFVKNLVLMITVNSGKITIIRPDKTLISAALLFLFLLLSGYYRAFHNEVITINQAINGMAYLIIYFLFSVSIFVNPLYLGVHHKLSYGICYSICTFILINVAMYFIWGEFFSAIRETADYTILGIGEPSTMLALLGIEKGRVLFPLATGLNSFATIAGAGVIIGVVFIIGKNSAFTHKLWGAISIPPSIFALLCVDSRFSVIAVFIILVLVLGYIRKSRQLPQRLLWFFPSVMILFPLAYLSLAKVTADLKLISLFIRSSSDIMTLNGRSLIWTQVFSTLFKFAPEQIIGYGIYGQISSGLSKYYPRFFSEYNTMHNFVFQYIFDIGYIGLCTFVIICTLVLNQLFKRTNSVKTSQNAYIILIALLVYFLLSGTTEATLTIYNRESFTLMILIIAASLSLYFPNNNDSY